MAQKSGEGPEPIKFEAGPLLPDDEAVLRQAAEAGDARAREIVEHANGQDNLPPSMRAFVHLYAHRLREGPSGASVEEERLWMFAQRESRLGRWKRGGSKARTRRPSVPRATSRDEVDSAVESQSLETLKERVRLHVTAGEYQEAAAVLRAVGQRFPQEAAVDLVSVAPDVLGPDLRLDGSGQALVPGYVEFTVITPDPEQAAAALSRVRGELYDVDERGEVMSADDRIEAGIEDSYYTPNWVSEVVISPVGPKVMLDTKNAMWAPMGRSMIGILRKVLAEDRIVAYIVGTLPDLEDAFEEWEGSSA